ncbi:MAG: GNAT family N-acetyltransferase, partial [Chloroflexi bacterium]|nr:GNAT family N-acetyltransferase [Chloroflexota bacterium]
MASAIDIPDLIDAGPVSLRPLTRDDIPRVQRWLNDPAVMAFWSGLDRPLSELESTEWVERFLRESASLCAASSSKPRNAPWALSSFRGIRATTTTGISPKSTSASASHPRGSSATAAPRSARCCA